MERFILKSVIFVRKSSKLTNAYIFDLEMNSVENVQWNINCVSQPLRKLTSHWFLTVWRSTIYGNSNLQKYNYPLHHTCQVLPWGCHCFQKENALYMVNIFALILSLRYIITAHCHCIKKMILRPIKCVFVGCNSSPAALSKGFVFRFWSQNRRKRE